MRIFYTVNKHEKWKQKLLVIAKFGENCMVFENVRKGKPPVTMSIKGEHSILYRTKLTWYDIQKVTKLPWYHIQKVTKIQLYFCGDLHIDLTNIHVLLHFKKEQKRAFLV